MGQTGSTTVAKRFVNEPSTIVDDTLEGFLWTTPGIARLGGLRVLVRSDWDRDVQGKEHVAVVGGGGAGHEPSDIGMIGAGMYTAIACGDIFAAPSVETIIDMLEFVTGKAGCIVILKNYLGDRLAFETAIKRVSSKGKLVRAVCVKDDIVPALLAQQSPEMQITEKEMDMARSIAGMQLVVKVTGAAAEAGLKFNDVEKEASAAANEVRTLGVCFDSCTIPGHSATITGACVDKDQLQVGSGIHGEPAPVGLCVNAAVSAKEIISTIVAKLNNAIPPEVPLCIMLNNLGTVPRNEMLILAREVMQTELAERIELFVGPAYMMTSLDMNGMSLSILPLDDCRRERLLADTLCPDWVKPVKPCIPKHILTFDRQSSPVTFQARCVPSVHEEAESALKAACKAICSAQAELDSLDDRVGNGDTGRNLACVAAQVEEQLGTLPLADPAALLWKLSRIFSTSGGALTSLLSIIFSNSSTILTDCNVSQWNIHSVSVALTQSLKLLKEISGIHEGAKSFLVALVPALAAAENGETWEGIAHAAVHGVWKTESMETSVGRAAYMAPKQLRGIADPGATAVALALTAIEASCRQGPYKLQQVTHVTDETFRQSLYDLGEEGKEELIGKGSFGKVFSAVSRNSDASCLGRLAIKVSDTDGEVAPHQFRQLGILRRQVLTNWLFSEKEHVVRVHEVAVSPRNIYVVMEQLTGPPLHVWLNSSSIPERQVAELTKQILMAAQTFHAYNMVHRDIQPANFMFADASCKLLKLLDVTGTMSFPQTQPSHFEDRVGTPSFMSPEALKLEPFSSATDMWSIGVTVFFMLSGMLPYDVEATSDGCKPTFEDLMRLQCTPVCFDAKPWATVSKEAIDFIKSLLVLQPEMRFTVDQALLHKWICEDVEQGPALTREVNDGPASVSLREMRAASAEVQKTVFLIRHGEAYHNIEEKRAKKQAAIEAKEQGLVEGSEAYTSMIEKARQAVLDDERFRDAALSENGRAMTLQARNKIQNLVQQGLLEPTCLLVSPLHRTLETASLIFPQHPNTHVRELLQERQTGFPCDTRSGSEITSEVEQFAFMSFNKLKQIDQCKQQFISVETGEAKPDVRFRSQLLAELLRDVEDESVAVVTHKGFLRELERGPLNQVNAKEFDNCEVRAYKVSLSARGIMQAVRIDNQNVI